MSIAPLPGELASQLDASYNSLRKTLALLDEEEISASRLANDWTAKALLAHVAFWDRVQTERMQAALSGASATTGFQRPTESNDQRAEADASRPLAMIVAEADAARQAMIQFAQQLTPSLLTQSFPEGEREFSLRAQLEHMINHSRLHAQEILDYCGSMRRWDQASLRGFVVQQHANLMDSISGLFEDTLLRTQVCGSWSIRDVLVHVLSWNEYEVLVLKQWPAAAAISIAAWIDGPDIDTINARLIAERADLDMIAVADGLTTQHRRVLRILDNATPETLGATGDFGWPDTLATTGDFGWRASGEMSQLIYLMALHETTHAEDIWRHRVGE